MYTLVLTQAERQAIDWIGDRYRHGTQLFDLLWHEKEIGWEDTNNENHDNFGWNDSVSITFTIPEHIAWQISEIIKENNYALECFGESLRSKLLNFDMWIV